MTEFTRSQMAGYALAAVLVVALGVRYLHSSTAAPANASTSGASSAHGRDSSLSVRSAPAGDAVVDVTGAVRRPGVYRLAADDRVQDAVRRAGGARAGADLAAVNLAAKLTDGAQILIPVRGHAAPAGGAGGVGTPAAPVNLNTATADQLDVLDGVGPTTAQKIVQFRQAHGGFGSIQDLDKIPGIGPKRIAALRGKVTV